MTAAGLIVGAALALALLARQLEQTRGRDRSPRRVAGTAFAIGLLTLAFVALVAMRLDDYLR